MSILANFEQWKIAKLEILEETDQLVKCPDCKGWGESECDCCGSEITCGMCEGEGTVKYSEADGYNPDLKEYYDECMTDLKRYCEWRSCDFFEHVAVFIRSLNKENPNWPWSIRRL